MHAVPEAIRNADTDRLCVNVSQAAVSLYVSIVVTEVPPLRLHARDRNTNDQQTRMSSNNTNPGNFANRPTEEAIASMGGKASHSGTGSSEEHSKHSDAELAEQGRNPDGTFKKGSSAASEAGHKGGLHSHDDDEKVDEKVEEGRNPDGTFTKGSEAAKEAGHKGGLASS
ncbi:hypothetical protein AMS68_006508 [Peltaster fructicola]|uniref:Conidiation-specific protein 10 n=1 Tax=Peltaster fructicola TaxID=286661 RepID=A0A6H0Y243_9PEZI|nr:hypothetical protein AMS68_006508 [Peltaster fructicola]